MTERVLITYEDSGVDYSVLDVLKLKAQQAAAATAHNLEQNFGLAEVAESRGESAYVWDDGDEYGAIVTEGLGTKNLVADAMREITGKTYYDVVAQDTVAMIVNDLITVGALPKVITAHFSVGESNWFNDQRRAQDLINGWRQACILAGAVWGPGETSTLKGILKPAAMELSGSAIGEIYPKERLMFGSRLQPNDAIILLSSSGVHASGLTLAGEVVAGRLPEGYATRLKDGSMYGESLLVPTLIYVDALKGLFATGVQPHYAVNITGHGWRKLMRADRELSYLINRISEPQPVFNLIQAYSGSSDREMYSNFNMGAGFAFFVAPEQVEFATEQIKRAGYGAFIAGSVQAGPKRVIIEPKNITFEAETLQVR